MLGGFESFLSGHAVAAPIVFVLIRSLGVLVPPVPGFALDLVGIAAFGWAWGLVYASCALLLGSSAAFLAARHYRTVVLRRFAFLSRAHEYEARLSRGVRFFSLVAMRLPFNPVFDYASYALGLTKTTLAEFIAATLIGVPPSLFVVYYFGGLSLMGGPMLAIPFLISLIAVILIFKESS
ncbi:MAG: TVP38/TMEM64 family protein [Candidatus Colwellbacteria bacterium]|nr:TVP38/TMEM64 family protein [Candidatus Colwellbacteria bacterium]